MNKQESQNKVSIIINGVRYDAVERMEEYGCLSKAVFITMFYLN